MTESSRGQPGPFQVRAAHGLSLREKAELPAGKRPAHKSAPGSPAFARSILPFPKDCVSVPQMVQTRKRLTSSSSGSVSSTRIRTATALFAARPVFSPLFSAYQDRPGDWQLRYAQTVRLPSYGHPHPDRPKRPPADGFPSRIPQ